MPFVSEEMVRAQAAKEHDQLTGLQRFEPNQLTLVAIVFSGRTGVAMVQDPTSRGYVLRKGMKIGITGVVDAIAPNAVIVKQAYQTISGETRYKTTEMILKKEGEKSK